MNEELKGIIEGMQEENASLVNQGLEPRYNDLDFENVVKTHKAQTVKAEETTTTDVEKTNGSTINVADVEPRSTATDSVYKQEDGSLELPNFHDDSPVVDPSITLGEGGGGEEDVFSGFIEGSDAVEVEEEENAWMKSFLKLKDKLIPKEVKEVKKEDEEYWIDDEGEKVEFLLDEVKIKDEAIKEEDDDLDDNVVEELKFSNITDNFSKINEGTELEGFVYDPGAGSMEDQKESFIESEKTSDPLEKVDIIPYKPGRQDVKVSNKIGKLSVPVAIAKSTIKIFKGAFDPKERADLYKTWEDLKYNAAPNMHYWMEASDIAMSKIIDGYTGGSSTLPDLTYGGYDGGETAWISPIGHLLTEEEAYKKMFGIDMSIIPSISHRESLLDDGWKYVYKNDLREVGWAYDKWLGNQIEYVVNIGDLRREIKDARITTGAKEGDFSTFFGGGLVAIVGMFETVVPAILTRGYSLIPQISGPMYMDFNIEKAKTLYPELSTQDGLKRLSERGEDEVMTPAILSLVAIVFERIGFKGVMKSFTGSAAKKSFIANMIATGNREGLTEWAQLGTEIINKSLAQGKTKAEALAIAWEYMASEEGLERYLMGVVGGSFMAGSGSTIRRALVRDKSSITHINQNLRSTADLHAQLLLAKTPEMQALIRKNIDLKVKELKKFIEEEIKKEGFLSSLEKMQLLHLVEEKNKILGEAAKFDKEYMKYSPNDQEGLAVMAAYDAELDRIDGEMTIIKEAANKRLIKDGIERAKNFVADDVFEVFKTVAELEQHLIEKGFTKKQIAKRLKSDGFYEPKLKKIYINREKAIQTGAVTVAQHEVGHFIFGSSLRDEDGNMTAKGIKTVFGFLKLLNKKDLTLIAKRVNANYDTSIVTEDGKPKLDEDGNFIYKDPNVVEEYLTAYIDAILKGDIKPTKKFLRAIGKDVQTKLKENGYTNIEFNDPKDILFWLNAYVKDMDNKSSVIERVKAVVKDYTAVFSTTVDLKPKVDALGNMTNEQWDNGGADMAIASIFGELDGVIKSKIPYETPPGFSEEDFIQATYVELIPHIRNFKPDQNDSLWGWIMSQVQNKVGNVFAKDEAVTKPDFDTSLEDEGSFVNEVESEEFIDLDIAIENDVTFSKLLDILGIERGGALYLKIKEGVKTIIPLELKNLDSKKFKTNIKEYFRAKLFADLKVLMGKPGSAQYIDFIKKNGKALYDLFPQAVFNKNFKNFIIKGKKLSPLELDKAIADGLMPPYDPANKKYRTSGPFLYTKKPYDETAWVNSFINIDRPGAKQNSLMDLFAWWLGSDATMEVINSEEFLAKNDVTDATVATIGMKIDRGANVMFMNSDGNQTTINSQNTDNKSIQTLGDLVRYVSNNVGFDEANPSELRIALEAEFGWIDSKIIDLVIIMADTDAIKNSDSEKFKAQVFKIYKEQELESVIDAIKDDGTVKYSKQAQERIYKAAVILANKLGPIVMNAIGYEILGFKNRVLDPAKKKLNPYYEKGKTKLDEFGNPMGKYLKDKDGNYIPGEYYDKLEALKLQVENPDVIAFHDVKLPEGLKIKDVEKMNKAFKIFKDIEKILFDGESTGEFDNNLDWKKAEIKKLAPRIKKAGEANIALAKFIAKTMIESGVDQAAIFHILQIQTSITGGFRALTTLDLITILEGSQKPDKNHPYFAFELDKAKKAVHGPKHKKAGQLKYDTPKKQFDAAIDALKTKGEHVKANANTMAEIAELDAKFRLDPNIDLDAELDKIFAKHSQLHTTKGVTGEIDDAGGSTNVNDDLRVMLTERRKDMFSPEGVEGEVVVATNTARFSKSEMIENIKLKNINQAPIQGATVMDFDDTIATSKSLIRYTKPDGTKGTLNAEQYAKTYQQLTKLGYEWDFSEFNEVVEGKRGPLFEKLKNQIAKYGADNVYILTARPMDAAVAIQAWLASEGINLPLKNITGLGNSTGEAKADWIENNLILNGFNDIYFVDDAHLNVEAVDKMFKTYPEGLLVEGGKSVLVEPNFSISGEFNQMIEENEGVGREKVYSAAKGKIEGRSKKNFWNLIFPPSAYDFELFLYRIIGKGKKGEEDLAWFKKHLLDPYNVAYRNMQEDAQRVTDDFKALVKKLPKVKKNLKKTIPGTRFTYEQALRVSIWNDMGLEVPGLSKTDLKKLLKAIDNDPGLIEFKEGLKDALSDGYPPPTDYWTVESVAYDMERSINAISRAKHLEVWKNNKDLIFSKKNRAKLEAIYGERYVESLDNMLYRMEFGGNKKKVSRIESNWNKWVNNSVGAIMFFNFRSATLQTISALNFVDWQNNTPYKAAKQFANVKRYRKNFVKILYSAYLKQRRGGGKRTINEAELTAYLKGKENPLKAALAWLLEKGFGPTSAADSLAIAVGGATYLANQEDFYIAQGKPVAEAERLAWIDFQNKSEQGQQSSRPDLLSEQQAGGLGRLILAFKNTQQQYFRIMTKAVLDIKNKRGSLKSNMSKIAYYAVLQNALFAALQTALFAAFDDDEEWDDKTDRMAQTMIDSILAGLGLTGAVVITVKNGILEYVEQKEKGFNADHTRTILQFANLSPTIGSKLRKLYGAIRTEQLNQDAIDKMGLDINSPAVNSIANLISAATNIPVDRAVTITQNLILASTDEANFNQSLALILGWSSWDIGMEPVSRKVQQEAKEERKKLMEKLKLMEKEKENLAKEKELKDKGICAGAKKDGKDCGLPVVEGTSFCTVHQKVKQRKDGKKVQCLKLKYKGTKKEKRCGTMTSAESGLCYYHD